MKSSMLVCSFFMYEARQKENIKSLNDEFAFINDESPENTITMSLYEVMRQFYNNYAISCVIEKVEKCFQIMPGSLLNDNEQTYLWLTFTVRSGRYNNSAKLVNRESGEITYEMTDTDAVVHDFYVFIYVPHDEQNDNNSKIHKGLMIFQSIGTYGVKTITVDLLKSFFSDHFSLTFRTGSIFSNEAADILLSDNYLKKITITRNQRPADRAEVIGLNYSKSETAYINPRITDRGAWHRIFSAAVDGVYEIGDEQVEDISASIKIGNTVRTASIGGFKNFSMTLDLSNSVYETDGQTVKRVAFINEAKSVCHDLARDINFIEGIVE